MNEKERILDMVEKGIIMAEDAARLLECLGDTEEKERAAENQRVRSDGERMKGKKLRVHVDGITGGSDKINVNVSVPLILARYADNIIANCVPNSAMEGLRDKGINIKDINISQIVDTFETLQEDIVNVAFKDDKDDLSVRVYVE